MQVKTLLAGIAAIVLAAGSASAVTSTGNGYWDQTSSWDSGVVPTAGTTVNIRNTDTITIRSSSPGADAFASNLAVHGFLVIEGGRTLTLDGGGIGNPTSIDSGQSITLGDSTNGGAILRFVSSSQTLTNGGSVIGAHANSKIEIDKGVRPQDAITLTNSAVVEGMMTVTVYPSSSGNGKTAFFNARVDANGSATTGVVKANLAGTLKFDSNVILADVEFVQSSTHYLPEWRAQSNGSAVLEFDRACDGSSASFPRLVGNFVISNCAMFKCLDQVETYGGLTFNAGTIDVNAGAGKQFIYNYGVGQTVVSADTTVNCP